MIRSGAILTYLCEQYGKDGQFNGKTVKERATINTWLTFQTSGLGPMQGQLNFFTFIGPKITGVPTEESIMKRYTDESYRCYGVLETQLALQKQAGSAFIASDRLSIADIAFQTW